MDIKPVSKIATILFFFVLIIILFIFPVFKLKNFHFLGLITDKRFLNAFIFGVETSFLATCLSSIIGIPIGLYLAKNQSIFAKIVDSIFDIPIIIPPLVIGAMLLLFFNSSFVNVIFSATGAIIAQFFVSFPYVLKAAKNSFELIPEKYEQMALTLGAKPFRSFFDTTFKLSFGGIFSGIILSWIRSFGEFGATLLIAGGIANKTENVPIFIFQTISEGDFDKGLSASILIVIIGIIFLFLIKKIKFR